MPPYDVNKDRVRKLTLSNRYFIHPFVRDSTERLDTNVSERLEENEGKGSAFFEQAKAKTTG
jgi:hypothetical protein